MENGAWTEMKLLKKISLASLLLPVLIFHTKDSALKKTIQEILVLQGQTLQNSRIISSDNLKIPEINQAPLPHYLKYYKRISPLIDHLEKKGFQLQNLLCDSRFEIYEDIRPSGKKLTLEEYKEAIEYENKKNRISGFIDKNIDKLEQAEKTYDGISKYIISATLGIESDFGDNLGSFNPFNVYFSMYADNYKKEFAKNQLEELLSLCKKKNMDIFSFKSSRAGAILACQFLFSSLDPYFVGDDLYDMENNIFSVANYLFQFKKKTGSLEEALHSYNPSGLYVRTVLDLARDAEELYSGSK